MRLLWPCFKSPGTTCSPWNTTRGHPDQSQNSLRGRAALDVAQTKKKNWTLKVRIHTPPPPTHSVHTHTRTDAVTGARGPKEGWAQSTTASPHTPNPYTVVGQLLANQVSGSPQERASAMQRSVLALLGMGLSWGLPGAIHLALANSGKSQEQRHSICNSTK